MGSVHSGPKDHRNIRISHSGWRVQDKGNSRNHGLSDPSAEVVLQAVCSGIGLLKASGLGEIELIHTGDHLNYSGAVLQTEL